MPTKRLTVALAIALTTLGAPRPAAAQPRSGARARALDAPTRPATPEVWRAAAPPSGLATLDLRALRERHERLGPELLGGALLAGVGSAAFIGGIGMMFGSFECPDSGDPAGPCTNDGDLLYGGIASTVLGLASLIPAVIWLASVDSERRRIDAERARRALRVGLGASPNGAAVSLQLRF